MKKLIIAVAFTFSAAFTCVTATVFAGVPHQFSSGQTASSSKVNENFDALVAEVANTINLPDGVTTTRGFLISTPVDLISGTVNVTPIFTGCDGADVQLSYTQIGLSIGQNDFTFFIPTLRTLSIAVRIDFGAVVTATTFTLSTISDLQSIFISRLGAEGADTCTDTLTLQGIRIDYPTVAGTRRLFLRGSESK